MNKRFNYLENESQIKELVITGFSSYYCKIGQDFTIFKYSIQLELDDRVPEFDSFSEYMNSFGDFRGSREKMIDKVYKDIEEILKPKSIVITTENIPRNSIFKVTR